jgi:hypothetical protein
MEDLLELDKGERDLEAASKIQITWEVREVTQVKEGFVQHGAVPQCCLIMQDSSRVPPDF